MAAAGVPSVPGEAHADKARHAVPSRNGSGIGKRAKDGKAVCVGGGMQEKSYTGAA